MTIGSKASAMSPQQRQLLNQRWEAILSELADIDHLKVVPYDPATREAELQAELREIEYQLTEEDDDREAA